MGEIHTAWDYRLARAVKMLTASKWPVSQPDGSFLVPSQQDGKPPYRVTVTIDDKECPGYVLTTSCTCQDWHAMDAALWEWPMNPGISRIGYCAACKHVIIVALYLGALKDVNIAIPVEWWQAAHTEMGVAIPA